MAGQIPCTCGCGKEGTYTTKRKHLNASGKTDLRARIVAEVQSLKRITRQQQEPTPPLQRGFRKRASSNPDQDGSRKQHKVAQIRENKLPQITTSSQADTDRESRFVERSRDMMETRWAASRRDRGSHSNGKDSDNDGEDEEEGGDGE